MSGNKNMTITKNCRKCGKVTPYEELVKHKQCTYGVDALCKTCNRAHAKQWYENNPEQARITQKEYYEAHKGKIKQYKSAWQSKNRKRLDVYHAEWRAQNREKIRQEQNTKRSQDPERYREYGRKWLRIPENLKKKNVQTRNRRANRKNAPGKHTREDILKQLEIQKDHCYWCSQPLNDNYHADHVLPVNRGGTNYPENLVCACPTCNCSKGDKLPYVEWQPPNPLFPPRQ